MTKTQGWILGAAVVVIVAIGAYLIGRDSVPVAQAASPGVAQATTAPTVNEVVEQPTEKPVVPDVQALQPTPPVEAENPAVASCIAQANADYPVNWSNACYTTYTDLQRYLENCNLPQKVEDQIDQERLSAIEACYPQNQ